MLSVGLAWFGTPILVALRDTGNRCGPIKMTLLCAAAALGAGVLATCAEMLDEVAALLAGSRTAKAAAALLGVLSLSALIGRGQIHRFLGFHPSFRGLVLVVACLTMTLATGAASGRYDLLGRLWWHVAICPFVILSRATPQRLGVVPGAFAPNESTPRVSGTLGNSSNLGVFLAGLAPLAAGTAVARSGAGRGRAMLSLAVWCAPVLLWTSSRGALLG